MCDVSESNVTVLKTVNNVKSYNLNGADGCMCSLTADENIMEISG